MDQLRVGLNSEDVQLSGFARLGRAPLLQTLGKEVVVGLPVIFGFKTRRTESGHSSGRHLRERTIPSEHPAGVRREASLGVRARCRALQYLVWVSTAGWG